MSAVLEYRGATILLDRVVSSLVGLKIRDNGAVGGLTGHIVHVDQRTITVCWEGQQPSTISLARVKAGRFSVEVPQS